MDDVEEVLEALHTLYAKIEELRAFEGPEFLLVGRTERYKEALEDAYAAFGKLETRIDELGQELEAHHARLDESVRKYGATQEDEP